MAPNSSVTGRQSPDTEQPLSLGARLAKNIADEKSASIELARRAAARESEIQSEKSKEVEDFFSHAKSHFERSILGGIPTNKIVIRVVRPTIPYGAGRMVNQSIHRTIDAYRHRGGEISSFSSSGVFHSIWIEFSSWANTNGLKAVWTECHDGTGINSWWELRVEPE